MGALDHVDSMVDRVCNHTTRRRGSVGFGFSFGVGAGKSENAEEWEGEGRELHDGGCLVCEESERVRC